MAKLSRQAVESLCSFVDERVRKEGCDHTHRFTQQWAARESVAWDDLLDILEANGGNCDCEVVLNLPEDTDLESAPRAAEQTGQNLWRVPPSFVAAADPTFTAMIVCDAKLGKNTHARDSEIMVPAPKGAKPRKRVRKLVHFFVGCASGLPSEVGVVAECQPISAEAFVRRVTEAGVEELKNFGPREAAFVLSKVSSLKPGTPVGTSFLDVVGVGEVHEELRIHRILIRK